VAINEEFVKEGAKKITEKDVQKVVDRSEKIKEKFTLYGPLKRFMNDARLLIAMIKDFSRRNYRQVPFATIGAIAFTLLYVLNPFDIIPDMLPFIGQVDDASVFAAAMMLIQRDLRQYQKWKETQPPQLTEG
jgi:uncharacterized membrane protein YkvA (DUF1232 family)